MSLLTNLVSYYKFDENTGTSVGDSAGANTGNFKGSGSKWVTGIINSGGSFDGASNGVTAPGFNNTINYGSMSVQAWVNFNSFPSDIRIIANSHTDIDNKGFQLYQTGAGAQLLFMVGNGTTQANSQKNLTIGTGSWFHLVGLYDGTNVTLYVNGTAAAASALSGAISAQTVDLGIGFNPSYNGDWVNGKIDEVALWNRALSSAEVTQLYNSGAGLQYPFSTSTPAMTFSGFAFSGALSIAGVGI